MATLLVIYPLLSANRQYNLAQANKQVSNSNIPTQAWITLRPPLIWTWELSCYCAYSLSFSGIRVGHGRSSLFRCSSGLETFQKTWPRALNPPLCTAALCSQWWFSLSHPDHKFQTYHLFLGQFTCFCCIFIAQTSIFLQFFRFQPQYSTYLC